jgi:DNA (cytosine-5)-methyltransferase 1
MTYGAELSSAWADHLAERKPDAPTVVSTFAGCGGSSLGYSMAGFRELLAVEWDDHAVEVFRHNFPDVPVHHGDIAQLDPASVELPPGGLDVLDGSPPCQGFSTSGRRQMHDSRNSLFKEYTRLLDAWAPRAFVMENVSGMVKGKMRLVFAEVLKTLRAAGPGYQVKARLLDASWFRVPQARQRLIFIGLREDLDAEPEHPRPRQQLTVRDAWADLADPGEVPAITSELGRKLARVIQPGQKGAAALKAAGRKGSYFNTQRLVWNRPSCTLVKSFGACGSPAIFHPAENRHLGRHELTRLQSFPDEFGWGRSAYKQIHARLGNSVPPMFMRAIATSVRDQLDRIDRRHREG